MYQENLLISTKINIPTICSKLINRPRLFKKLDTFLNYKLILINAPAGYGKTALATSWIAEKQKSKLITTWLSLDEEDNDPELFWSYFLSSFYKNISVANEMKESAKILFKSSALFNKLYLSHFINDIATLDVELLMVIDEFNVISDNRIIENLKFLIKNMPPNMHILISCRSFPDLGLARLRAADSVVEINQQDLCFTSEETTQFFNKFTGIELPYDKCNMIRNESEGWAAGMQMMALSIKNLNENNLGEYVHRNDRFIFDYITEEVFSNLNESIKEFLLYTSVLERFSSELCNYLLDIENSKEIIKEINSLNLFLVSIDSEDNWFRYHNLFRNFLKKQLDNSDTKIVYQLFDKAAQWYESNKQINKAVENYIEGKNLKKAVRLIEQVSSEILCRGEAKLLFKWNQMLPADIVRTNPRLIMNNAWALSADGKTDRIWEYIKMVQEFEQLSSRMNAEIVALYSSNPIGPNDDLDRIIEDCRNAIQCLQPKEFLTQLIVLNMASAYLFKGELREAIHYFEKCLSISIEIGELYIAIVAEKALITSAKWRGQYRRAEQEAMKLASSLNMNEGITFPAAGLLYAGLSDVYYQWNELEKSLEMAKKGLNLGLAGEDNWTVAENCLMLAKIYNAMGLDKEYMDVIKKAGECLTGNQLFDIRLKLESYKAEISIRKRIIEPASKWLSDIVPIIKDGLIIIYPEIYILKIRLFIYKNEFKKAREVLDVLQRNAERKELFGLLAELMILSSMVYERLGDTNRAMIELEKALRLSWEQKMARIFLDEGSWMEEMLKKLERNIKQEGSEDVHEFIDILLNCFKENFKLDIIESEEILSLREMEILELIQQGATNSEISAKLFISVNTVKSHLLNIYTKLDVHSRTSAVAKAKDLNLM
jgi:LuxR family maltose regulon positive regulatory protein